MGAIAAGSAIGRLRRSVLLPAIGANVATQAALTVAQLAVVPAFARAWGSAAYGGWLMLFTIPAYLAMADLGFGTAAGNAVATAAARREWIAAAEAYHALRAVTRAMALTVPVGAAALLVLVAPALPGAVERATGGHADAVVLLLTLYGAASLYGGGAAAGMRATGGYAAAQLIWAATFLAEAGGALFALWLGRGMVAVAACYAILRLTGVAAMHAALVRRAPWLMQSRRRHHGPMLRTLVKPAAAAMVLPIAQGLSLQGMVLVIGIAASSAAVPAFAAVRTLSRGAIQAILLVNHALMPLVTIAAAQGDEETLARHARTNGLVAGVFGLSAALVLVIGGQRIVMLWTHGAIRPGFALVAALAAATLLNAQWQPASNLILAVGRHARFTWFYLVAATASLAIAVPLAMRLGAAGAALAVLVLDAAMVLRVAWLLRNGSVARATTA